MMNKQEMSSLSEKKVAEHFARLGYTSETFMQVNKDHVAKIFPEVNQLQEERI